MIVTHPIKMDLTRRGTPPRIDAVQDDKYSRDLEISLYSNGTAWTPGAGVSAIVHYVKPDGTGGSYNFLPDEKPAWRIDRNVVTVALAPQVCTVPGRVKLAVCLIKDAEQISTFVIELDVQGNRGLRVTSKDYYKVSGTLPNFGWEPGKLLGTNEEGDVVAVESPETGVHTINGVGPDKSGNINITFSAMPLPAKAQVGELFRVKKVGTGGRVTAVETFALQLGEPVSHMYNDWQLPPMPQWDTAAYPYAVVSVVSSLGVAYDAFFTVLSELTTEAGTTGADVIPYTSTSALRTHIAWTSAGSVPAVWPELTAHDADGNILLRNVKWTNRDVYHADGTLYLAASEPVPVYGYAGCSCGDTGADSSGGGLALVDILDTVIPADGTVVALSEAVSKALAEAAAVQMPCIIRTYINTGGIVVLMTFHSVYMQTSEVTGMFAFVDMSSGKICRFYPAEDGWKAVIAANE